jgi:hypothetical protein
VCRCVCVCVVCCVCGWVGWVLSTWVRRLWKKLFYCAAVCGARRKTASAVRYAVLGGEVLRFCLRGKRKFNFSHLKIGLTFRSIASVCFRLRYGELLCGVVRTEFLCKTGIPPDFSQVSLSAEMHGPLRSVCGCARMRLTTPPATHNTNTHTLPPQPRGNTHPKHSEHHTQKSNGILDTQRHCG